MFEIDRYAACIAEGSAEQAIIDKLLDEHCLVFERENLIDESVLRCRDAKTFETRYLRKGFDGKITIFRILDSRRENFRLSKAYQHKVDVVNVITAPEIEMLIILNENKYAEFKRSGMKPSEFCKVKLKLRNVKAYDFVSEYFKDVDTLFNAVKKYVEVSKIPKGEHTIADLLKKIALCVYSVTLAVTLPAAAPKSPMGFVTIDHADSAFWINSFLSASVFLS